MKQASRDTGPMRGCAHRGFVSRPASVQPPRMRVGQNPARGTEDPTPRWSASSANAKWPLSMEGVSDRTSRCWSRGSGGSGLGGSCPGGPTRRRERMVRRKPERERRQRRQRSVTSVASVENIPGTVASLEVEVNVTRRSGDKGVRAHPLPRSAWWVPKPIATREAKASRTAPGANEYG